MYELIKYINFYSPLTKEAEIDCLCRIKTQNFKKGELINDIGQICKNFFYIEKGLVKHCFYNKNRSYIIGFFSEKEIFTAIESFNMQTASSYTTVALEKTETEYFSYRDVQELCKKHHCFETFLRIAYTRASILGIKRTKELLEDDSIDVYKRFIFENRNLLQRISLSDIASYIGISQVSLSRIRSRKKI